MQHTKVLRWVLLFLGLFLIIFGSLRLIDPVTSFVNLGTTLGDDVGLLNEARATGGTMLGFGLLIFLGAFKKKLAFTSTLVAVVLFFSFGIGRLMGLILDGNPGEGLMTGMVTEFAFGLLALFMLIKYRDKY